MSKGWPKRVSLFIAALVLIFGFAESMARIFIGSPPLSIGDSKTEYMFAPNQKGRRFGNSYAFNSFGMRSGEVPAKGGARDCFGYG
jgi:hypothetical protein